MYLKDSVPSDSPVRSLDVLSFARIKCVIRSASLNMYFSIKFASRICCQIIEKCAYFILT